MESRVEKEKKGRKRKHGETDTDKEVVYDDESEATLSGPDSLFDDMNVIRMQGDIALPCLRQRRQLRSGYTVTTANVYTTTIVSRHINLVTLTQQEIEKISSFKCDFCL